MTGIIIVLLLLVIFFILTHNEMKKAEIKKELPIETKEKKDSFIEVSKNPTESHVYLFDDYRSSNPIYSLPDATNEEVKIIIESPLRSVDIKNADVDIWEISSWSTPNNIYTMTEGQLRANGVINKVLSVRKGQNYKGDVGTEDPIKKFYLVINRAYPEVNVDRYRYH